MSLVDEIKTAFLVAEPALAHEAVSLLAVVFSSADPRSAINSAKLALISDAADMATDMVTDAALREALGKPNEP